MTIEEAAQGLYERVGGAPWFTAVGVGQHEREPCIFVYVKSLNVPALDTLKAGWMGYPVQVRQMGTPQPAQEGSAAPPATGWHLKNDKMLTIR
jgi:hypothetical protein